LSSSSDDERRIILSVRDFDVPAQPIEFAAFLDNEARETFEQISTIRLDPRFARPRAAPGAAEDGKGEAMTDAAVAAVVDRDHCPSNDGGTILDVTPAAGTLVLFDSVTLPHLVREVTGTRQRIAATGWFHEDSQFVLEV
jgi:hypothetical protein